ncbi:hypothetical protein ACHQM5_005331 [Ranunculus cassubicifolius]
MATTNMKLLLLLIITILSPFCNAASSLFTSQSLNANQVLRTGSFTFRMQSDCNLVLYDGARAVWASNTQGRGTNCFVTLQDDGNLVVYLPPDRRVIWASNTARERSTGYELRLQSDRNLVIYGPNRAVVWATNTQVRMSDKKNREVNNIFTGQALNSNQALQNGEYSLRMQSDCNLVLYDGTRAIWETRTNGRGTNCFLTLQNNGNLVVYLPPDRRVIWASNTQSALSTGYELRLQSDRNLVVYGPNSVVVWSTNTQNRRMSDKNLGDKSPGKT